MPVSYSRCFNCLIAGSELNPGTDLAHGHPVIEGKKRKANDIGNDKRHGEADEEGGVFEGTQGQHGEVCKDVPAGQLPRVAIADAVGEEPKIASLHVSTLSLIQEGWMEHIMLTMTK